jgi:hypothetical protein
MAAAAGFNGLGRPLYGVAVNIVRGLVLIAPLAWIGGLVAGVPGVIWGVFAGNILIGIGAAWFVLRRAPLSAVDGAQRKTKPAAATGAPAMALEDREAAPAIRDDGKGGTKG